MNRVMDGNAVVYCQGAFNTTNGKTAHGLVRFTERYRILSVIDSSYAGRDAGAVLDGKESGIPVYENLDRAVTEAWEAGTPASYLVVGLAPDGGRLSHVAREDLKKAIGKGLNIDSGLHDFITEDPELVKLAAESGVTLRDIRKPPPRNELHFFSGKIEQVQSFRIAVLGTDSAVGKRTTAWILVRGLRDEGISAEMIGTGQTAWMQGARYSILFDSLINDFVSGEIEHAVFSAWKDSAPEVIVLEGQGSLMNPAYPGGFEILAAGRPDIVILQHAPARIDYDGFPGYRIHPLPRQIQAVEVISEKKVAAIAVNHENISDEDIPEVCDRITRETGIPAFDPLRDGPAGMIRELQFYFSESGKNLQSRKQ
ncbi:MAG: DUF1611 domain-containing protein [Candidatus Latescibacteria bacterium]|nr:DUF1611 domain-containing protein [bacterium]MBD3423514.1 DUF1611 domain-containing protein [Candidatus Latescibacterota bacterium]